jgi:hypothetical protein
VAFLALVFNLDPGRLPGGWLTVELRCSTGPFRK